MPDYRRAAIGCACSLAVKSPGQTQTHHRLTLASGELRAQAFLFHWYGTYATGRWLRWDGLPAALPHATIYDLPRSCYRETRCSELLVMLILLESARSFQLHDLQYGLRVAVDCRGQILVASKIPEHRCRKHLHHQCGVGGSMSGEPVNHVRKIRRQE